MKYICDTTKHLPECNKKHSKDLPSTQKLHCITIENKKVVGYILPNKNMPLSTSDQAKLGESEE